MRTQRRMPLGDTWTGTCRATEEHTPADGPTPHPLCNLGYARGRCAQFPEDGAVDAVRFHAPQAANLNDANAVQDVAVQYVMELRWRPAGTGIVHLSRTSAPDGQQAATLLERQAAAWLRTWSADA